MATRWTEITPAAGPGPAAGEPGTDLYRYWQVERRMCTRADQDSRRVDIARALGCSQATRHHLNTAAMRSHRAWQRAADALVATQLHEHAEPNSYVHGAHFPNARQEPMPSSADGFVPVCRCDDGDYCVVHRLAPAGGGE